MERQQFQQLLHHFTSLSGEDTQELLKLQREYPYSQVIQSLAARATQDHQFEDRSHYLNLSAIYSTDRNVLKEILSAPAQTRSAPVPAKAPKSVPKAVPSNEIAIEAIASIDISDQVMQDVNLLHQSMHRFELAADKVIKSLDKQEKKAEKKSTGAEKKHEPTDELIEEIKTSKKKLKTVDPKQKEQHEIIDQFIKAQPTIGKITPTPAKGASEPVDLSEKSAMFGENIISETLVEILLKQGKKDKAIEVLKKLIWKFPQKKAYFAARIEELKK